MRSSGLSPGSAVLWPLLERESEIDGWSEVSEHHDIVMERIRTGSLPLLLGHRRLVILVEDLHADEQWPILSVFRVILLESTKVGFVDRVQTILGCHPESNVRCTLSCGISHVDALDEVIPSNDVLRDVVDCVLQEEEISMAEHRLAFTFLEANVIHLVTEVKLALRILVQLLPANYQLETRQISRGTTYSKKSAFGIVPTNTPPGRSQRETFSSIWRAFAVLSNA
jgi:hypothetical protein